MTRIVYFEDLEIGARFVSEPEEILEEAIRAFARDNDPQPFHVDPQAARDSLFGGLVASGWQTAALTVRHILYRSGATFAGGAIGVDAQISWKRPVRPGDRLHVEGEITSLRPSRTLPNRGIAGFEARTCDSGGRVVQTMTATILFNRDPRRAGGAVNDF